MQLSKCSLTTAEMEAFIGVESTLNSDSRDKDAASDRDHPKSGRTAAPLTNGIGGGTGDRHEFVVTRVNCGRPQESGRRLEQPMDSAGSKMASAQQISN